VGNNVYSLTFACYLKEPADALKVDDEKRGDQLFFMCMIFFIQIGIVICMFIEIKNDDIQVLGSSKFISVFIVRFVCAVAL